VLKGTTGASRAASVAALTTAAGAVACRVSVGAQSRRARSRPSSTTLYAMSISTAVLALAIVWPRIEPYLIDLLRARP
jgi:hypothetical protein